MSILLVLAEHVSGALDFPLERNRIMALELGSKGVTLFFAISGFLITTLLLREYRKRGYISLGHFYIRRALRILPVYACFVICIFALSAAGKVHLHAGEWMGMLTYTANLISGKNGFIAHLWSLSLEEQFYLIWPFVLVVLGPRRSAYVILAYLMCAPLCRVVARVYFRDNPALAYTSPLAMEAIALGCLLALSLADRSIVKRLYLSTRQAAVVSVIAVALMVGTSCLVAPSLRLLLGYALSGIAATLLIWAVAFLPSKFFLGRFLASKPMVTLGVLSYSIYIWQQLFFQRNCHWLLSLACAIVAGALSFVLVERPFLRLKEQWQRGN